MPLPIRPRLRCPAFPRCALLGWLLLALADTGFAENMGVTRPGLVRGNSQMDEFWWAEPFDPVRFTSPSTTHYFAQDPRLAETYFFFPPMPPPLYGDIPLFGSLLVQGPPAPPAVAPHVHDLFYPVLASWLTTEDLPPPLQTQVTAYAAARFALQQELRSRLAELKEEDSATRDRALAELAAQQTPRLQALEEQAEKLRENLLAGLPYGPRTGWQDFMPAAIKAGDKEYSDSVSLELQANATQVAAFYQEGLTAAQRQLLRATAHELALAARAAPTPGGPRTFAFSPAPARLRLPAALPDALEKLLARHEAQRRLLVEDLQQALRQPWSSPEARASALRRLAAAQAASFEQLDTLAEEIRREFAALPQVQSALTTPSLPPELAARIAAYRRQREESLKVLHGLLAGTGPAGKASVAEFDRRQAELLEGLNRENAAIRVALADHMRASGQREDGKSVDDLLRDFENARQLQESRTRFRDYHTAVLLPGLNPWQRRLLFDAAVGQLNLPLPSGQRMR